MGLFETTDVEKRKRELADGAASLFGEVERRHTAMFNKLWTPPAGVTVQQVVDAFGPDALALFQLSASLQDLMEASDPTYVRLETPNEVIISETGVVTIGDPVVPDPGE